MHFEWEQKEIIVLIHSMKASSGTFLVLLSTFRVRGHSKLTKSIYQSTYYYNYLRALLNTIIEILFRKTQNTMLFFTTQTNHTMDEDIGQMPIRSKSGHHAAQKLKRQNNIFFNGNCTMVICSSH